MVRFCKVASTFGGHGVAPLFSQVNRTNVAECEILKKLDHPNVIRLYELIDDLSNDSIYLILDFIAGSSRLLSLACLTPSVRTPDTC